MARGTRCKVCHARDVEVDANGRCLCCRMALIASREGLTYGVLAARLFVAGRPAEALDGDDLPPVQDKRPQNRYSI